MIKDYLLIALRSAGVYLFIISAIRISGKKELSQLSIIDLVFIMLISNAVQNAMVGSWDDFKGGIVSAGALFLLNHVFKIIFFRNRHIAKLVQGNPVFLIRNGMVLTDNLSREKITMEELEAAAREHGEDSLSKVDLAVLETDGSISVVSKNYHHQTNRKRKHSKELPGSVSN